MISRERPDFLQFGLQALDDSSDPRQEAAREAEKEVGILFWNKNDLDLLFIDETLQALILEKQLEAVLDGLNQGDGENSTLLRMSPL